MVEVDILNCGIIDDDDLNMLVSLHRHIVLYMQMYAKFDGRTGWVEAIAECLKRSAAGKGVVTVSSPYQFCIRRVQLTFENSDQELYWKLKT